MALAAAVALCVGSAPARARGAAEPLAGLNEVRARLGLAPLGGNPVADPLVSELAAGDFRDEPPRVLGSQPDCVVCEVVFGPDGLGVDPRDVYVRHGGKGTVGFALMRRGWAAAQNLSVFFPAAAMALDPRARTFSAAATPKGMLVVAFTVDPNAPFTAPIRWPQGAADPSRQLWTEILLPPGARGDPLVTERRGSRDVTVAYPLADSPGLAGARLVAFGLNATLAYRHRYVARVGAVAVPFSTLAPPAAFLRRSWRFIHMSPEAQEAFRRVFRRGPPLFRRLVSELDGAVRVIGAGRGCHAADACERVAEGVASIGIDHVEPFVVLHEFGHVVLDLGLDEAGARAFEAAFLHSPLWHGGCCPYLHGLFADQFAFWVLGGRPRGVISYGYPQLLSRARFGQLLAENYGYRPRPILGPLAPEPALALP